ncbi:MAG: hypothetical protein NQU41_03385 [Candidatus Methanosuratincola sp.]|jgi:hypothetical protein|nr:hypothetical protein [Candidatus Methanosuratincola sp.]
MGASRGNRDFLGLVSFGTFLVAVGSLFAFIPNLVDRLREFITDFELLEISQGIYLPVVRGPHPEVYSFLLWLGIAMAVTNAIILVARFTIRDSVRRRADTLSGIIFWAGIAILADQLSRQNLEFQAVYSYLIIIAGISILSSGIGLLLAKRASRSHSG